MAVHPASSTRDGHTIVLTTHYLEEAEALCGRIAMMKAGPHRRARHHRATCCAASPSHALRAAAGAGRALPAALRPRARVLRTATAPGTLGLGGCAEVEDRCCARCARRASRSRTCELAGARPRGRCSCGSWRRTTACGGGAHDREPAVGCARCSTRSCCASGR
ncbi:MAG: hypothetical protein MZW92_18125 [Comamonadaceae bacterium]|nr:hypothetical protein [Comamonadaceae bacterium]